MNERMYELINQCFIGTTDGLLSQLNTVANIEKFAELIVRDISQMIESQDVDPAFKHRMSWAVKDRYGVE